MANCTTKGYKKGGTTKCGCDTPKRGKRKAPQYNKGGKVRGIGCATKGATPCKEY